VLVTRCGNNYGTRQYPEKLIPLMVKRAVNNEKLPVYGDGFQVRDWIHVKDHCRAIFLLIEKGRMGQVYNIGGDNEVANMAIVKAILKETGKDESLIAHVADRKGHDRRYAVDHTKITQELGWQPQEDFKKELIETIRWYMNQ
jgi:dTDP-glucose 4,6-dehydratase